MSQLVSHNYAVVSVESDKIMVLHINSYIMLYKVS